MGTLTSNFQMLWLTSRNCRNIQHSLRIWTPTYKRSNGRPRETTDGSWRTTGCGMFLRREIPYAVGDATPQFSQIVRSQRKEPLLSEGEEFEKLPEAIPKWMRDQVELYLSDPEKARLWGSTIGGGSRPAAAPLPRDEWEVCRYRLEG